MGAFNKTWNGMKGLHYIFDPLCGWCYGAGAAVAALADHADVQLHLLPSGLFAGEGARPMNAEFAAYAWSNDQRIERLTGQPFSERYRTEVLANHQQMFDSGPATFALTAVALTEPLREVEALKALQQARYVDGVDITDMDSLQAIFGRLRLTDAAARLARPDSVLLEANTRRTGQARQLMQQLGARGVPSFVLQAGDKYQLLPSSAAFSDPQGFLQQVLAA